VLNDIFFLINQIFTSSLETTSRCSYIPESATADKLLMNIQYRIDPKITSNLVTCIKADIQLLFQLNIKIPEIQLVFFPILYGRDYFERMLCSF